MKDYSEEQESYREKSKERIQKQLQYGKFLFFKGPVVTDQPKS